MFREGIRGPARHRDHRALGLERRLYGSLAEKFQRGRYLPRRRRRASVSPRPAGLATTPRSRMRSISAGKLARPCSKAGAGLSCSTATRPSGRAIARRNTTYARGFADSLGLFRAAAGAGGRRTGRRGGAQAHRRPLQSPRPLRGSNIPGITFGGRYDGFADRGVRRHGAAARCRQQLPAHWLARAGRAPHLWLGDGRSLYDALGFEFTLLQLGSNARRYGRRSVPPPTR
jgi:hypothetical protein